MPQKTYSVKKKKIIMYFAYHVTPNSQMAKDNPLVLHSTQKKFLVKLQNTSMIPIHDERVYIKGSKYNFNEILY
jgi:hypothetical protein